MESTLEKIQQKVEVIEEKVANLEAELEAVKAKLKVEQDTVERQFLRAEKLGLDGLLRSLNEQIVELLKERNSFVQDQEGDGKSITVLLTPMSNESFLTQLNKLIRGPRDLKELLKGVESVGLLPISKEDFAEPDANNLDADDGGGLMLSAEKLRRIPKLVVTFEELEDGAIYTVGTSSKYFVRQVRQQLGHTLQAYEDQLGEATLSYAEANSTPGTVCSLRLKEPDGRTSMEVDAVVFAGNDTAYVTSHKLHIAGSKPVKDIAEAAELVARRSQDPHYRHTGYAQFGRFPKLGAVLGAEKVETKSEAMIRKACVENHVVQFKRNGRSFSVMSMHSVQRGQFGHVRAFGRM